jgi:hypothetical protein
MTAAARSGAFGRQEGRQNENAMSKTFEVELKKCLTGSKCLTVRVEADSAEEAKDKALVNEMKGQSSEAD